MPSNVSQPDHPFPPLGGTQDIFFPRSGVRDVPTIVAGEGVYLVDDAGRRLLDVCSGPFLANLGQGNEQVLGAMLALWGLAGGLIGARFFRWMPTGDR